METKSSVSTGSVSYGRTIMVGLLVGIAFGFAFEKSKVFFPQVVRGQMQMTGFIMMKMFLAATATGLVAIGVMEKFGYLSRVSKASRLCGQYGANVVGGLLLGSGMTITGACPGTVLSQFGSLVSSSSFTLLGCLGGALSFGYVHKFLSSLIQGFMETSHAPTLDQLFGKPPLQLSLTVAAVFAAFTLLLEYLVPWTEEIKSVLVNVPNEHSFGIFSKAWPPAFAGVVIGLLQIPSYLFVGVSLGTSSSYVAIASQVSKFFNPNHHKHAPYFTSFTKPSDLYQVGLIFGIMLGTAISVYISGSVYNIKLVVSPLEAFMGGILLIYGARLAGGCTSGHGISGIARLSSASFVTTACMFAGGMVTASLFY